MSVKGPDLRRRLVPRWRAFSDAVRAGELASSQPLPASITPATSAQFEQARSEWSDGPKQVYVAAELISCGVVLGTLDSPEVRDAAKFLIGSSVPEELKLLAQRVLEGSTSTAKAQDPFPFDPVRARSLIHASIAASKRKLRQYPKNAIAWTDLTRLYTAVGQHRKAMECIQIALSLAPNNRFVLRSAARFLVHADGEKQDENLGEGLFHLRRSASIRTDPWIIAAEISLSDIAGRDPASIKWARALDKADRVHPRHSSEMFGAMATMAIRGHGLGKPGKLFARSLQCPTENALAQAKWAESEHGGILVSDQLFGRVDATPHEARALKHRAEHKWREVIEDCRQWSQSEPTSTRPLVLGTFVAIAALQDGATAREFTERAMLFAPNAPWVHNNMAVARAYMGDIAGAKESVARIALSEVPEDSQAVVYATQGLIAYRSGDRVAGNELYLRAASREVARNDTGLIAMALWHWLREETRIGAAVPAEFREKLWTKTRALRIHELEAMNNEILKAQSGLGGKVRKTLMRIAGRDVELPAAGNQIPVDLDRLFHG